MAGCDFYMVITNTKPTFQNLRSMMHSWRTLGDSGVENGTFFVRKRTHFDIHFQASFLMSFWLKFGAKKVPKMGPKSQLLKIIFTKLVHKISTLGLMGHFAASCATSGHFGSIWGPFWVDLRSILGRFWTHFGAILGWCCCHLWFSRRIVHDMLDTPLRATGHH